MTHSSKVLKKRAHTKWRPPEFLHHPEIASQLAYRLNIPASAVAIEEYRPDPRSGKQSMVEVVIARERVNIALVRSQTTRFGSLYLGDGFCVKIHAKVVIFTTDNGAFGALRKYLVQVIR